VRGQDRFNIYCTPCHDHTGYGNGMIVRRGFRHPPSYHTDKIRQLSNGFIFDVITQGFGAMPDWPHRYRRATGGPSWPTCARCN